MLKTIERFRLENEYMSCAVLHFLWIDIQHMMEYENKLSYLPFWLVHNLWELKAYLTDPY